MMPSRTSNVRSNPGKNPNSLLELFDRCAARAVVIERATVGRMKRVSFLSPR